MSTIHQLYCTHCTHGSSALERREGDIAHRMLGYSVRAGSLPGQQLREIYRQVERYIYYYLPRDTPAEEKLWLTAASAPRRLIYFPSTSGLKIVGQICYRQKDTEGRPGSYFAHLLFCRVQDGQKTWSQLDCLRLWQAQGWVEEDRPDFPDLLDGIETIDEMLLGARPAIDDGVFRSFLSTPSGGAYDDGAGVIPPRWQHTEPSQRHALFMEAFRGFTEITSGPRRSLLLVSEPSLAALLFYGVLRLLPCGPMRDTVSFSTFEPNPERLTASLAATVFYNPAETDLRPESYRSQAYVINTFSNRSSECRQQAVYYAQSMIQLLVEEGWEAVDCRLRDLEMVGVGKTDDLEALTSVDRLVPTLFDRKAPPPNEQWRSSPKAAAYLRQILFGKLSHVEDTAARLSPVIGRPAHLLILEAIATDPMQPAVFVAVDYLLRNIPADMVGRLLKLDAVSTEAKIDVLVRHVTETAQLPSGCEHLWAGRCLDFDDKESAPDPLLPQLLSRLDSQTLEALYQNVAATHADALLEALICSCRQNAGSRSALTQTVAAMSDGPLLSLFRRLGPELLRTYPQDEPAMGQKLHAILHSLPDRPAEFSQRLDFVLAGERLLPDDQDLEIAKSWRICRRAMIELGRLQDQKSGMLRTPPVLEMERACQQMAEVAAVALSSDRYTDDAKGTNRKDLLSCIGHAVLDSRPLLPKGVWQYDALWKKVTWYFEKGIWTRTPLKQMAGVLVRVRPLVFVLLPVVVVVASALAYSIWSGATGGEDPSGTVAEGERETKKTNAAIALQRDPRREQGATGTTVVKKPISNGQGDPAPDKVPPAESPVPVFPGLPNTETAETPSLELPPLGSDQDASAASAQPPMPDHADQQPTTAQPTDQPAVAPDPRPPPDEHKDWETRARHFADNHRGVFVNETLNNGAVEIPWNVLSFEKRPSLKLGPGKLVYQTKSYSFGGDFDNPAPATRQTIPQLAIDVGLQSVFVELEFRNSVPFLVVRGEGVTIPADLSEQPKEEIDALKRNWRLIQTHLRKYNAQRATQEDRDEAYDALVELLQYEIPKVPDKPNLYSDEFRENRNEYEAAMRRYDAAVRANSQAKSGVISGAKNTVSELDKEITRREAEIRQLEAGVRRENAQLLSELKEKSRSINVVVYQPTPGTGESQSTGKTEDKPATGNEPDGASAGIRPEATSAHRQIPSAETPSGKIPQIQGTSSQQTSQATGLVPPQVARIEPMVVGASGRPLPSWFRQNIVTGCQLLEKGPTGPGRPISLPDLQVYKRSPIFQGAHRVLYKFTFFLRPADSVRAEPVLLAQTTWYELTPIEPNASYSIRFEVDKTGMDKLQNLMDTKRTE